MDEVDCTKFLFGVFTAGYFRNVSNIDLNSVRLCFQVFLPDANKKFTHIVQPVVSQPIIDKSLFLNHFLVTFKKYIVVIHYQLGTTNFSIFPFRHF